MAGESVALQAEILARYRAAHEAPARSDAAPRTVAQLCDEAEAHVKTRRQVEARERSAAKAEQARVAAALREKVLEALAPREGAAWKQVDDLIATRKPSEFDVAVQLLVDLRDLAARDGRVQEAWRRIAELRSAHARKPTLIERMDKEKLLPPGS